MKKVVTPMTPPNLAVCVQIDRTLPLAFGRAILVISAAIGDDNVDRRLSDAPTGDRNCTVEMIIF